MNELFVYAALGIALVACPAAGTIGHAAEPERQAGVEGFVLADGLRLELMASEPLVESPCALAFDARGRLFVAENRGYPTGPPDGGEPLGRIALLEDRDGDGRYDARTDFATGLTFPNGLMPWRDGLLVTSAHRGAVSGRYRWRRPGRRAARRADGFQHGRQHPAPRQPPDAGHRQLGLHHQRLDGRQDQLAVAPDQQPVEVGRTDIRFNPDTGIVEPADGGSQFGLSFDDFGRRFICYNRVHVQHVVLSSKWLRRNPHLAFSDTVENCPAEMVAEPAKGHGRAAQIFPLSHNVTTADSHAGTFTAACGVTVYRGTALPAEYRGGVFACDPTANLIHFDRLEPRGDIHRSPG